MLTAMGYDWVPGNLAGALALDRAGELATRVDVGYFITGSGASMSGGTRASMVGAITAPAFAFRDGRVQTERGAKRVRSFRVGSKDLPGVSVGQLRALHAAALRAATARGERLPRLVRAGVAGDAGALGMHVGGDEGARRRGALERGDRALRAGLDRRPRRGGAREVAARTSSRSPTTPPAAS